MKILHVLNGSHCGGASVMAAELAAAQRKLGADAQLCLLEGGTSAERIRSLGLPVLAHDPEGPFSSKRERWNALFAGFRRIARDFEPDILHSHLALPNLFCARLQKQVGTKWIATLHGSWKQYSYSPETMSAPWRKPYLLLRYALGVAVTTRNADILVTMTNSAARDWRKSGIAQNRLRVIPNGIAAIPPQSKDVVDEQRSPDSGFVFGSLGYLAPVKGFDLLIAAFDMIAEQHPRASLVIAGGDVLRNESVRNALVIQIHSSRAADRMKILGSQADTVRFLASLDCYVSASLSEGMSLALLEAMHLGLPSVVSSAGGNPEVVRDGLDGLVFQSGNIADLADKLERILADTKAATEMGNSARLRAQTEFTILRCANDYLNLYNEVLNS